VSAPLSPLNDLDRLTGLTRRYADYGSRKAGLIGVLGGLLLALSSGLGSGWWQLHRASGPAIAASGSGSWRVFLFETEKLPLWVVLPVWATPLVFLAISAVLRRRVYQPLGPVKAVDNTPVPPNPQILWSCFAAVVGTMLLGFALGWFHGQEAWALRILGEILVGAVYIAMVRVRKPRGDELTLAQLIFLNAGLATGFSAGLWSICSWLYLGFGLVYLVRGVAQHRDYRQLQRELEALAPQEKT